VLFADVSFLPLETCLIFLPYGLDSSLANWFADKFVGTNTGIKVSTCDDKTNFDTQISVYSGSCGALQCLAGNDDSACGLSSAALFFGAQDVTYHVRVHGYSDQKGDFGLTIEEANIALATCEEMTMYMDNPLSGAVCECTESGKDAVMTCSDDCSYCNADKSVCATKTTESTLTSSLNSNVTAKSATYTYTQGLDGILVFDTTGCGMDDTCSGCSVTFNGAQCNSCTPSQCSGGFPSFDIDCANVDPNAIVSLCDSPVIESGPLQVLSSDGFATCVRDPMEACNGVKAYQTENYQYSCECTGSDTTATLTCSDPYCSMSCNLDFTVCWKDSMATIFDANGQQSSSGEINTYTKGRDEVVAWEGRGYDSCTMTVNGEACNSCGPITCPDGSILQAVDCENIESGASFDLCGSYSVEGATGVLQAFNDYEVLSCLTISDPQAVCQDEVDYNSWVGTTCECAPDPITGTDYILTCEGSCLACNSENTVCANFSSATIINMYGMYYSRTRSYTYLSGDGRDETVVLNGLDDGGDDCSITVNGTPCNSCGKITCTDASGYEYDGTAVDCENVEAGASYDNCENYGTWVVETGVLEVLSYEFGGNCATAGDESGQEQEAEEEANTTTSNNSNNNNNNG
jgi:hypothetical protein